MAEWELIQDRTISGKGVLRIPGDTKKSRSYVLYVDIIRDPSNQYLNLAWNPVRSRYGNLVFLRNNYIVDVRTLDFEHQAFDGINDISGQTLIALKCAYDGMLRSVANLGTALGSSVTSIEDKIKDYENLRNAWDEVRLCCYGDSAVQLRAYRMKYDTCDPDKDKDKPPPPPPPPKRKRPRGEPITDLSPPYDPYSDNPNYGDNGDTSPSPVDNPGDPPGTVVCTLRFTASQSKFPASSESVAFVVPNSTYDSAYVDITATGSTTYTYYARSSGSAGVITLGGPFTPDLDNTIIYSDFSVTCV